MSRLETISVFEPKKSVALTTGGTGNGSSRSSGIWITPALPAGIVTPFAYVVSAIVTGEFGYPISTRVNCAGVVAAFLTATSMFRRQASATSPLRAETRSTAILPPSSGAAQASVSGFACAPAVEAAQVTTTMVMKTAGTARRTRPPPGAVLRSLVQLPSGEKSSGQ